MDVVAYRLAETLGKRAIGSLRQAGIHYPGYFESTGFLTRIESSDDLVSLLDVMHSNRYEDFVTELGGLDDDDMAELVDAFVDYARFFMANFPSTRIPMPLSGMLSQYAAARKIRGIPKRATVLEIGPGSGLISFFLARDPAIVRYDQIEAVESFYLLQNLVNRHVYGHRFLDHAQLDPGAAGLGDLGFDAIRKGRPDVLANYEVPRSVVLARRPRAEHVPWWKLAMAAARRYDVVVSNANLTEFSEEALRYYTGLVSQVLSPDGVFLVQCVGGGTMGIDTALRTVLEAGLVAMTILPRHIGTDPTAPTAMPEGKQAAVANFVFIGPRHPNYEGVVRRRQSVPFLDIADPVTRSMFEFGRPPAAKRSRDELMAAITERLKGLD